MVNFNLIDRCTRAFVTFSQKEHFAVALVTTLHQACHLQPNLTNLAISTAKSAVFLPNLRAISWVVMAKKFWYQKHFFVIVFLTVRTEPRYLCYI